MLQIFPFLEKSLFDEHKEPQDYKCWIAKIEREMNDTDATEESWDSMLAPTSSKKNAVRGADSVQGYRLPQDFLLMLARFRRVILQDVAEYEYLLHLNGKSTWTGWRLPFVDEFPEIFKSRDYLAYRALVWGALEREHSKRLNLPTPPEDPVDLPPLAFKFLHDIDAHHREMAVQLDVLQMRYAEIQARNDVILERVHRLDPMLEQLIKLLSAPTLLPASDGSSTNSSSIQPISPATPITPIVPSLATLPASMVFPPAAALDGHCQVAGRGGGFSIGYRYTNVKDLILERLRYEGRSMADGPVGGTVRTNMCIRKKIVDYIYFLAQSKHNATQDEVNTAVKTGLSHPAIDAVQRLKDAKYGLSCTTWDVFSRECAVLMENKEVCTAKR